MNIVLSVINQERQVTVKITAKSKGELSPIIQNIPALVFLTMMEQSLAPSEELEQTEEQYRIGFTLGEGDDEEGNRQEG
jgi:hypothetical protein